MKRMALIGIAALSLGSLLLAPNDAEARHRHCRPRVHVHRTYRYVPSYTYSQPTYYAPAYYDYDYGYPGGYYDSYDYRPLRRSIKGVRPTAVRALPLPRSGALLAPSHVSPHRLVSSGFVPRGSGGGSPPRLIAAHEFTSGAAPRTTGSRPAR
jgi:hypothetical protein